MDTTNMPNPLNRRYLRARAKAVVKATIAVLPKHLQYATRSVLERLAYNLSPPVPDLPPIFLYWADRFLRPRFETLGFSGPEDFYFQAIRQRRSEAGGGIRVMSVGCGRCELELGLAARLAGDGIGDVRFVCIDTNATMLKDALGAVERAGLRDAFEFRVTDIRDLSASEHHEVVMAHECLHHFVELERLFDAVAGIIGDDGCFLTYDVIGRNGHQLWPEALDEIGTWWAMLPESYKFDNATGRISRQFVNYDHSNFGFEGIRAQDILPLLVERFHFQVFAAHTNLVLPFVERRFGYNFDPGRAFDRDFIDRVALRDIELVDNGTLTPTQLLAHMTTKPTATTLTLNGRAPEQCIRPTRQ